MSTRLHKYQVDVVRGWARADRLAGLSESEAAQRACGYTAGADDHVREIVSEVFGTRRAQKAAR